MYGRVKWVSMGRGCACVYGRVDCACTMRMCVCECMHGEREDVCIQKGRSRYMGRGRMCVHRRGRVGTWGEGG